MFIFRDVLPWHVLAHERCLKYKSLIANDEAFYSNPGPLTR